MFFITSVSTVYKIICEYNIVTTVIIGITACAIVVYVEKNSKCGFYFLLIPTPCSEDTSSMASFYISLVPGILFLILKFTILPINFDPHNINKGTKASWCTIPYTDRR